MSDDEGGKSGEKEVTKRVEIMKIMFTSQATKVRKLLPFPVAVGLRRSSGSDMLALRGTMKRSIKAG